MSKHHKDANGKATFSPGGWTVRYLTSDIMGKPRVGMQAIPPSRARRDCFGYEFHDRDGLVAAFLAVLSVTRNDPPGEDGEDG